MIGQTIGHYEILERLGEGGMGVVYKARDIRLERPVVLKFSHPYSTASPEEKERFLREAQAAAALDHPNICTVHEVGEVDGAVFIVMAYVDGADLRKTLSQGPLPIEKALDLAIQVCEGLKEAHEAKLVHRDIKSANIMVTPKGQAKILDFGLAKLPGRSGLTKPGTTLGTPAYMAPEQIQGLPADHRADVWAVGVLLYEMVTGVLPFRGEYEQAVMYSIVNEAPPPLASLRSTVPQELERITGKALAKAPDERYQSAGELAGDLRNLRDRLASGTGISVSSQARAAQTPSIAVLPFVNLNRDEDSEFFSDGITEDILNALMKLKGLKVAARSSVFQFKGKQPEISEVGRKLKVGAVLEGAVRRAGNRLRITVQLINVADGYQVWSERYDRVMEDIFDIQDEISRAIVENLRVRLVGEEERPLVERYTTDLDAYNLYLRGRYHYNKRTSSAMRKAIEYFEQAIAADPNLGPAYVGLADTYGLMGFYGALPGSVVEEKTDPLVERILEMAGSSAEAQSTLACREAVARGNWAEGDRRFQRALEMNPNLARAHYHYAILCLTPLGRFQEAESELRRARELEPLTPVFHAASALLAFHRGSTDRAMALLDTALELDPHLPPALAFLGGIRITQGRYEEAVAVIEKAKASLPPGNPLGDGLLSYCYGRLGKKEKTREILHGLEDLARRAYVPAISFAAAYIGLGQADAAFEWLDRASEDRTGLFAFAARLDPMYDGLRGEPRFGALLRKMGLPENIDQ